MKKDLSDSPKIPKYRALMVRLPEGHFGCRITSWTLRYAAVFVIGIALLVGLALSSAGLFERSYAGEAVPRVLQTSTSGRVFVVNTGSNSVSVIDDGSGAVIASIPVGERPIRVVASSDGQKVYVSNFHDASISVIDAVNLAVTATISVPPSPQESDITIDGTRLFVVHHPQQVVSVIGLATNTLLTVIPIGDTMAFGKTATDILFTPDGRYAFVPNYFQNVVDVIDTTTYAVTALPTGAQPRRVAITPNGERVFVSDFTGDSVTAVDALSLSVIDTIPTGTGARGIAINPQGTEVYVTNVRDRTVTVLATDTLTVLGQIRVGDKPWNVIFNADGSLAINHADGG